MPHDKQTTSDQPLRDAACSRVVEWLINGWVGASSKTMAAITLGIIPDRIDHPYDTDDLNRCLLLMEFAPVVRDALPKIGQQSKVWGALVGRWDEIEQSFLAEAGLNWCKARNARKTYNLMRDIIDNANAKGDAPGANETP